MKKQFKAALLSAFVLPGAGHFFLKAKVMGSLLAASSFSGLYLIISNTLEKAQTIADKILRGEAPSDMSSIAELASSEAMNIHSGQMNIAMTVLLVAWCISIVDSYRLGMQQDKKVEHRNSAS